jgi:serine protease SohB
LFKDFVQKHRAVLDINQVATGEHWFGYQALELKLVDELSTSDEYLLTQLPTRQVYQVKYQLKKGLAEKVGLSAATAIQSLWQQAQRMIVWR